MQIISNNNLVKNNNTIFKAMPQKLISSSNPLVQKKVLIKLGTIAGLSGLIAMVTSFFNKGVKADDENIIALKNKYTEINNSYLTNPETLGTYLDITSASDSKDAELRAKGISGLTAETSTPKLDIIADIDIAPEQLETFVTASQGQNLDTILNQSEIITLSPNNEIICKTLDDKINKLAIKAEQLRTDGKTSELYKIFSEIAKLVSLSSLTEFYTNSPKQEKVETISSIEKEPNTILVEEPIVESVILDEKFEEEVITKNESISENKTETQNIFTPIVLPENSKVTLNVRAGAKPETESKFFVIIKSFDTSDTIQIYNTLASIYNQICGENRKEKSINNNEEIKNSKLLDIIYKRVEAIKNLKLENQKVEIEKLLNEFNTQAIQEDYTITPQEEIVYTPELFKTKILEPRANTKGYDILCETFGKYSALICNIYNSIQKDNLRETFVSKLAEKDRSSELEQYIRYGGLNSKIDFMSYLGIVDFKNSMKLDLTLTDFREIDAYKDVTLKYSTYDTKGGEKVSLYFRDDADYKKRLETAVVYLRSLFSIKQKDIIKPSLDEVTSETVIKELKKKLSKDPDEYEKLLSFIGLKLKPEFKGIKLTEEDIQILIDEQLKNKDIKDRFNLIVSALQNINFDEFVQGTHGRMRFIERIVLEDKKVDNKELQRLLDSKIKRIKYEIETKYPIILTKYETIDDDDYDGKRYSPQLRLGLNGKYILGLNNKGQIHTIYPAKTYKKY